MICELCGYDDSKPLGTSLDDAKTAGTLRIKVNTNGQRAFFCKKQHLASKYKALDADALRLLASKIN